jgi:hypothetical protein
LCEEWLLFPAALFLAPIGIGLLLWPYAADLNRKPLLALRKNRPSVYLAP